MRDNRLFAAVKPGCGTSTIGGCRYGLSWARGSANGRSVVQHDGSWSGARSFLRLYQTTDQVDTRPRLVIAIMPIGATAMRATTSPPSISSARDDLGAEILATEVED